MALFLSLMGTGVVIVMIYIWSGESIVALLLSIITLFAILGIWQWQPWAIDDSDVTDSRRSGGDRLSRGGRSLINLAEDEDGDEPKRSGSAADAEGPCWRGTFDITWDERGLSGVPIDSQAPQMWAWTQIDDIAYDWTVADQQSRSLEERLAFRLDFPDMRNPEEPVQAWVMFGPDQEPAEVQRAARDAWRESKVKRSRFHDLSPQERTTLFADHLAPEALDLTGSPNSPELLYQEIRRALLDGGELCRLGTDAHFDEILDSFDRMLAANDADPITEAEADELAASSGKDRVASMHRTLDWVVEQRGYRMVFVEQVDGSRGDDYLIGLIPAVSADDWDGQTVGSGAARVTLDRPT